MRPHTPEEVDRWAHGRQPHEREALPQPGEEVLFREADFAVPKAAIVYDVMDLSSPHNHWHRHGDLEAERGPGVPDPGVWRWDAQQRRHVMLDDPWPWVHVQVIRLNPDGSRMLDEDGNLMLDPPRWCKEARVRGSAGWLREGSRAHTYEYGED